MIDWFFVFATNNEPVNGVGFLIGRGLCGEVERTGRDGALVEQVADSVRVLVGIHVRPGTAETRRAVAREKATEPRNSRSFHGHDKQIEPD